MDTAQWNREWAMTDEESGEEMTEEERIADEELARASIAEEFDALYAVAVPPAEAEWTKAECAKHTVVGVTA